MLNPILVKLKELIDSLFKVTRPEPTQIVPKPKPAPTQNIAQEIIETRPVEESINLKAYRLALKELGQAEIPGEKDNPRIVLYHSYTQGKADSDEVAWCSAFMNYCIVEAGGVGTGSALARSWLRWGKAVGKPQLGDIVIFSSSRGPWAGHVGFFCEDLGDSILVLGGNQSNKVSFAPYPKSRLLGYQRAHSP